jgi:hypothetical protein
MLLCEVIVPVQYIRLHYQRGDLLTELPCRMAASIWLADAKQTTSVTEALYVCGQVCDLNKEVWL